MTPQPIRSRLFLLAALIVLAPAAASDQRPSPVSVDDVHLLPISQGQSPLPGATRHRHTVTLGASFDAPLMHVLVEEGQWVEEGEIIARLDNRVATASHALASEEASHTASIDRAQASLARADRALERALDAHARNGVSDEELDDMRTGVDLARAELAQALEQRSAAARAAEQAAARLAEHDIRAPFSGAVLRVHARVGSVLRTGDPIADIADPRSISADLYLPAATALRVERGACYAIAIDEPVSRTVWARVRYVEPRVDPTSATMRTVFDFEAPDGVVPAGVLIRPASSKPSAEDLAWLQGGAPAPAVADAAATPVSLR